MTRIFVKQFVSGKFSNQNRPRYDIVAKSRNISDTEIENVIRVFNGGRPLATEIPNFRGAWLISPVSSQEIALLRQERSLEMELGRQHFLYEHYKVFNKKDLKQIHKVWLFVLKSYQQEIFRSFTYLDNQIDMDDDFFLGVLSSTLAELFTATTEGLGELTIKYLHTLLNKRKLNIQGSAVDLYRYSTALSLMLPSAQLNNYKAYFGNDLPYSWSWDIAFLENSGWKDANSLPTEKILSDKINNSYTKIVYKILKSNQDNWQDFPNRLENIKLDVMQNQNDLERVLGNAVFHDIGLRLINVEIKLQRANAEDVHIAWRELSELTNAQDIAIILPVMLEDEGNWDKNDFAALGNNITRHEDVIFQCLSDLHQNNPEKFQIFLLSWLEKQPSQKELDFIGNMLYDFYFQNISILLTILEKKDGLDFKVLILLFDNKGLSDREALILTNIILGKTKTKKEISEIISVKVNDIENQFLRRMVDCLVSSVSGNGTLSFKRRFAAIREDLSAMPTEDRNNFCENLLVFAVNLQLENVLTLLLFEHQKSYEFVSLIDISKIRDLEFWATSTRSKSISASYVIVLHETNNGQQAKEYLTQVILEDAKRYESIFDVLQKSPDPRKYSPISLQKIGDLEPEDAVEKLIQYTKITKLSTLEEKAYLMAILKEIPHTPLVADQLESVYPIFLYAGFTDICQLILELQVRDAILIKNQSKFKEKMNALLDSPKPPKSLLRNRIVADYLNALSMSSEKKSFLKNILLEPYSNHYYPKFLSKVPATSLLFRDSFKEIFEDVNCRLEMYQWAYKEWSASKKA